MRFEGYVFPPHGSQKQRAVLTIGADESLRLQFEGHDEFAAPKQMVFSDPVGNLPIQLTFPSGWKFDADDPQSLKTLSRKYSRRRILPGVESYWFAVTAVILLCLAILGTGVHYGVPWLSRTIVASIPVSMEQAFGDQIFEHTDDQWQQSDIPNEQQELIRQRLEANLASIDYNGMPIKLKFRAMGQEANAFAFPGGTVVVLDGLVDLAQTDQQLDSIILHEVGHVYHRHGLHQVVESSIVGISVALFTGELSGALDSMVGVGTFLLDNGRSRGAEEEADLFAKNAMIEIYGSPQGMIEIFELLDQNSDVDVPEWISTHPEMQQRIEDLQQ